jgi:hypothetical protein
MTFNAAGTRFARASKVGVNRTAEPSPPWRSRPCPARGKSPIPKSRALVDHELGTFNADPPILQTAPITRFEVER